MRLTRTVYLSFGWICVALGVAGAFLPLLPTTPFLLLALWAFARSSPAAAEWLRQHPRLGPYIRDWQDHHSIPVNAKVLAILMMLASFAWLNYATDASLAIKLIVAAILLSAATFILTRPSL